MDPCGTPHVIYAYADDLEYVSVYCLRRQKEITENSGIWCDRIYGKCNNTVSFHSIICVGVNCLTTLRCHG